MTTFVKIAASVTGVVGTGAAVGVPLVFHSGIVQSSSTSRASTSSASLVSLDKCESLNQNTLSEIPFGSPNVKEGCWSLLPQESTLTNSSDFSKFFKDQWRAGSLNWNSSENQQQWTQQCVGTDINSQWVVVGADSNFQHLGYKCEADPNTTMFVKKTKNETEVQKDLKFWVCESSCWTVESSARNNNHVILSQENSSHWKEVKFYNKENN